MELSKARALTPWWTDVDIASLHEFAKRIRANTADLAVAMVCETGGNPNAPQHHDGGSAATGLLQITPVRARAMGITEAQRLALWKMPVAQQLPWMLRACQSTPWVQQGKTFKSAAHLYLLNFAPAYMDRIDDDNFVCYRDTDKWHPARDNPAINKWPKDDKITIQEIKNYVAQCAKYQVTDAFVTRIQHVTGDPSIKPNLDDPSLLAAISKPSARGFAAVAVLGTLAVAGVAGVAYWALNAR